MVIEGMGMEEIDQAENAIWVEKRAWERNKPKKEEEHENEIRKDESKG